ncbi:MAG: hypothetical protein ABIQ36_07370 [Rhodanobacter sp.]
MAAHGLVLQRWLSTTPGSKVARRRQIIPLLAELAVPFVGCALPTPDPIAIALVARLRHQQASSKHNPAYLKAAAPAVVALLMTLWLAPHALQRRGGRSSRSKSRQRTSALTLCFEIRLP